MKIKIILYFVVISLLFTNVHSKERLILASTTSTYDSGFLNYINKFFEKKNNVKIHVISVGTGQALELGKKGDADILLIHHKESELDFIKNGYGIIRYELMYNDYIIIGPKNNKNNCKKIEDFLKIIDKNNLNFISRGDKSGTHYKELELWELANIAPEKELNNYKKIGQGMGATLMITNELKAYTLADRATWINYNNKTNLKIVCENQPPLINQYGIIAVNPKLNKRINYKLSLKYIDWIVSDEGKELINNFKKNNEQLFFYNFE